MVAWDSSLSDFKHLCIPLLKITLAFQNTGFSRNVHGVTRTRAILASWTGQIRFRITVYFRETSGAPPCEEEGRREVGLLESHRS